jgi:hypothetical protein
LVFSEVGNTRGASPFAKSRCKGERPAYDVRYIPPRLFAAALPRCVLARQGWAGEKVALFEHPAQFLLLSSI